MIHILGGGNFFGENALASDRPRAVHAIALTEVRAMRIDPDALLSLIHGNGAVCDAVISCLIAMNLRVVASCADNILYSSEKRLARVLVSLATVYEDPALRPIPRISQQDLANMIGVTRQRVNFLIKRFRKTVVGKRGAGALKNHSVMGSLTGKGLLELKQVLSRADLED